MRKVQFQCRQHVPAPSFSGSCTVGPFLAHPLQSRTSHALYTLAFPGDGFPPTVFISSKEFKAQLQVPQIWLFNQGLFPPASSLQIPLHVRHLYLEISQPAYTHHIHWGLSLHQHLYPSHPQEALPLLLQIYLIWWYSDPAGYPSQEAPSLPFPYCQYSMTLNTCQFISFILPTAASSIPHWPSPALSTIIFQLVCKASSCMACKYYTAAEVIYLEHRSDHLTLPFSSFILQDKVQTP